MPRALTERFVAALKPKPKDYMVADALVPGLKVRVRPSGHKSFILRRRVDPRASGASSLDLGAVGQLSLADARTKAREWLQQLEQGVDPRLAARAERASTFAAAAEMFLERHVKGQRRGEAVTREIRNELVSRWGNLPLAAVKRQHVVQMVSEIVDRGAKAQARNVLINCKVLFSWLVERGMLENSPADHVSLTRLIGERQPRQRVLNDDELRALWAASNQLDYPHRQFLHMLVLSGQRCNEVAGARWREFDLTNKLWTVPAERFKSGSNHVVPLSDAMVDLLATLPRWGDGDCLFSYNTGRTPLKNSGTLKERLDEAMGGVPHFVLHDIRRTVRTRLSALSVAEHVAELTIGHSRRGLARIYDQHRYQDEVRDALQRWADKLQTIVTGPATEQMGVHTHLVPDLTKV